MEKKILLAVLFLILVGCNNKKNKESFSRKEHVEESANWAKEDTIQFEYLPKGWFDYGTEGDLQHTLAMVKKIENTKVAIFRDTLFIDGKYKASFVKKKWSFDKFFGENAGSWVEEKLSNGFKEKGIDIKNDSISFLQINLPVYQDFTFGDYSMWGTVIYEQGYLCLIHQENVIGWFRDNQLHLNKNNSNVLPFDLLDLDKADFDKAERKYKFADEYNDNVLKKLYSVQLNEEVDDISSTMCFYLPLEKFDVFYYIQKENTFRILTIDKRSKKILGYIDFKRSYKDSWQEQSFDISEDLIITFYKNELGEEIIFEDSYCENPPVFRKIIKSIPYEKYRIEVTGKIIKLEGDNISS